MTLTESQSQVLQKQSTMPQFSLKDTNGGIINTPTNELVLIVFMCNHCPYVIAKLDELNRIASDFTEKLTVIGINSNNNPDYPQDSYEKMQEMVANGDIKFTYVLDEDQSVAKLFGAACTPDPFLFHDGKLIFHSRIANPPGTGDITDSEMYEAISEFLEKGSISAGEKPSMGCNIKWVK